MGDLGEVEAARNAGEAAKVAAAVEEGAVGAAPLDTPQPPVGVEGMMLLQPPQPGLCRVLWEDVLLLLLLLLLLLGRRHWVGIRLLIRSVAEVKAEAEALPHTHSGTLTARRRIKRRLPTTTGRTGH